MNQTHVTINLTFIKALRLYFKDFIYLTIYLRVFVAAFHGSLVETWTLKPDEKTFQHNMTKPVWICMVYFGTREEIREPTTTDTKQEKDSSRTDSSRQPSESCRCSCLFYLVVIHLRQSDDGTKRQITFCKKAGAHLSPAFPQNYYQSCPAKSSATPR